LRAGQPLLTMADGAIEAIDLQHFRSGELLFGRGAVEPEALGRSIEFQLPTDEHDAWGAVRGGLTVSLPPPGGPPV
jgi:hypothetical protein